MKPGAPMAEQKGTVGHTPGPWKAPDGQFIRGGPEEVIIAGVLPWNVSAEEGAANVKLIAAAPALAEELELATRLVARIVEYDHYATDDDTPAEILARIEADAREVATLIGYCGFTCAALRVAAGRIP